MLWLVNIASGCPLKKSHVIGIVGAVGVIALVGWLIERGTPPPTLPQTGTAPQRTPTAPELAPPASQPPPGGATSEQKAEEAPSFDIVRVERGHAVIAGRAAPGARVTVLDGDKVIGETTANERGEWVLMPDQPFPPGNHELGLSAKLEDGRALNSERVVVVVVPEENKTIAGQPAPGALAVEVPRRGGGASRVLQAPSRGGAGAGTLALDVVDYDQAGQVVLSGRGRPGAAVQIYLDNRFLGRAAIGAGGGWKLVPQSKIEPRLYTMRIDEVNDRGKVAERIVIPFSRAKPGPLPPGAVVVQLGNNLWQIARRDFGEGVRYTVIYGANKDQIKDPDLIYTGQVFAVPATTN